VFIVSVALFWKTDKLPLITRSPLISTLAFMETSPSTLNVELIVAALETAKVEFKVVPLVTAKV